MQQYIIASRYIMSPGHDVKLHPGIPLSKVGTPLVPLPGLRWRCRQQGIGWSPWRKNPCGQRLGTTTANGRTLKSQPLALSQDY